MKKIKLIVLGTGQTTKEFIQINYDSELIDVVGVVLDQAVSIEDRNQFVEDLHNIVDSSIKILPFSEETFDKADIVFSLEYRRIIPGNYSTKYLILNCHGGILPKWRGFAANAWAIMNDETEIGYSIHRVTSELDGGDVYFVKHIPITEDQTYADVHKLMTTSISKEVPQVLYDVVYNRNPGIRQQNKEIAYCTKFTAQMGILSDFDRNSSYYVNLYRCMAKPLGTGLFIYYKGIKYEIGRIEHGCKYGSIDYCAIPGKIVNVQEGKIWVKTRDNVIILSDVQPCAEVDKQYQSLYSIFINGSMIGK